jgi:hypothetical protein
MSETEFGKITWHSSDEDSGPDVGMMLGLGDGKALWVGEISRRSHEEGGEAVTALGDDGGWWLGVYEPKFRPLAKFADAEDARDFFDLIVHHAGTMAQGARQVARKSGITGLGKPAQFSGFGGTR